MHNSIIRQITRTLSIQEALTTVGIPYTIKGNTVCISNNPFRKENTCSLTGYLNTNLLHDFGSGKTYNSFDILCLANSIKDAIRLANNLNKNPIPYLAKSYNDTKPFQPNKAKLNFEEEFNKFERINLKNKVHITEFNKIFPIEKWSNPNITSFLEQYCRYDKRNSTLVVGIYNQTILVGYKWRRLEIANSIKKWIARKNSTASTPMLHICNPNHPIFVCEGMHDFLSAVMANRNVLSIPSSNYIQNLPEYIINQCKNLEIYLVPDNDEVGFKLMERIKQQLLNYQILTIEFLLPKGTHDFSEFLAAQ